MDQPPTTPDPAPDPVPDPAPEPAQDPAARPNPILSASQVAPASEPSTGWELPAPAAGPPGSYVIAGVGARLVAYLLDATIVSIIPTLLTILVLDLRALLDATFEAAQSGTTGPTTFPVTLGLVLVTLIGVGLNFIYFVGFWTSGGRATPAMRLMRMQVVDVVTGGRMELMPAIKRWVLLGSPLALLSVISPLQSAAGPLSGLILLIIFLTIVADDRRRGFHDQKSGSLVIREATAGDGATIAGCLILIVLAVVLAIVAGIVAFAILGSQLQDYFPVDGTTI